MRKANITHINRSTCSLTCRSDSSVESHGKKLYGLSCFPKSCSEYKIIISHMYLYNAEEEFCHNNVTHLTLTRIFVDRRADRSLRKNDYSVTSDDASSQFRSEL